MDASNVQHIKTMNTVTGKHDSTQAKWLERKKRVETNGTMKCQTFSNVEWQNQLRFEIL